MTLTREQIEIMNHTVHRAAGGFYCGDSPDMQELVKAGLMDFAGYKFGDKYFTITRAGREALRESRKATITK